MNSDSQTLQGAEPMVAFSCFPWKRSIPSSESIPTPKSMAVGCPNYCDEDLIHLGLQLTSLGAKR